jgi:hypothetical protein
MVLPFVIVFPLDAHPSYPKAEDHDARERGVRGLYGRPPGTRLKSHIT